MRKTVSTEKLLGNLTPEQRKEFAAQFNGGLGSGLTPEQYKAKYHSDKTSHGGEKQAHSDKASHRGEKQAHSDKASHRGEKQAHRGQQSSATSHKNRPGIEANVWSRFDDDGWGIYNVQHPAQNAEDEKKTK